MWWFRQIRKHLPIATGPFMPGCIDVMLGYNKEDPFLRLYYPTHEKKDAQNNIERFIPWIPDDSYLTGFSKVIMIHVYILRILFWWSDRICIPALYGAKIKTDEKLKCIVMSHGLGGNRFLYTNISCELASRGFLVACLEHRDLSACNTYYYENREDALKDKRTPLDFLYIKLGENHYKERNKQIKIRSQECGKVLDFLINLNKGIVPYNVINDVPTKYDVSFQLDDLVGKLDVNDFTMMGHSFGAATALYTLSKRKEFKQAILLDPWMFAVKNEDLEVKIDQPLLFVNTQTFHIKQNVNAMSKFLTRDDRKMYTIKHTTHENQSDTVLVMGYWLNWFMKKLDPLVALRINNALVVEFLNRHVDWPVDIEEDKQYLKEQKNNFEFGLTKPWA
ncbi:platelet-activating factor acetylhydrolase-like [Anoplophora glabripennis]|uniref:platelet-activating factor acetylhydrolase-like n=1 Tax=Anoplophora glabripennis TaxID=217634 RepID=UPI000874F397|nr:platelet-activating factor acetylhydrolase-like [Anoplophora glabripennis]